MSWLFGKKRVAPKVPFPSSLEEGALRFPTASRSDRVIEPEELKEAAGVEEPASEMPEKPKFSLFKKNVVAPPVVEPVFQASHDPHYIRLDSYRAVLGELEHLKTQTAHWQAIQNHLQTSEYNEETKFVKLRRAVRGIHDRLLQVDKIVFKG